MKIKTLLWAIVAAVLASMFLYTPTAISETLPLKPQLSERQQVWAHALEWCESKAVPTAINKKDRDGTPSYGIYQFKPGTLSYYAKLYGIPPAKDVMSTTTQRAVVDAMILDAKHIDWHQQFPDCVKLLGKPPA